MGTELVLASAELIEKLKPRLRAADEFECRAMGMAGAQALEESYRNSTAAWVVLLAGEPVAAGGVVPVGSLLSRVGIPWCLTGGGLTVAGRGFLRASRKVRDEYFIPRYRFLYNLVDARHVAAVRWVKWLGFTLEAAVPVGVNGELFYPFWMRS